MKNLVPPSFFRRIQYNTIDLLFIIIVLIIITNLFPFFSEIPTIVNWLLFGSLGIVYDILFHKYMNFTPGQDLMGMFLRKNDERGVNPVNKQLAIRFIIKYYLWPFVILSILIDKERRGLHDKIANTVLLEVEQPKGQKRVYTNSYQEWGDSISFAIVVATFVRWIWLEPYTIPTGSMEKTLMVGDFLFVNKMSYGTRMPITPLQIPLTHQKIWMTNMKSFSDAIRLPYFRLPGFTKIKNNDIVVFNYPADEAQYPIDLKTNYIKRCIAIPGDTLVIQSKQIYINGKAIVNPPNMQHLFKCFTKTELSNRTLDKYRLKYEIHSYDILVEPQPYGNTLCYYISMTQQAAEKLRKNKAFDSVATCFWREIEQSQQLFPFSKKSLHWNNDDYGPLWVPSKGATIKLDSNMIQTYGLTIQHYEGDKSVELAGDKLIIDGKPVSEYTFKQDYYFMMGDNRHNSSDCRVWGFVPEDHIVGKAWMVWLSMDSELPFPSRIRWKRSFMMIK
ncbi:MAG: signal peptidase I [Cytophagales bacterium]|nr:signal peptidase I [Cytophaga sp.]